MVLWRDGSKLSSVACSRYDEPDYAFGAPERVRTFRNLDPEQFMGGYSKHCDELEGLEKMDCYLEASTEVVIVDLKDGTSLLFVPEDPSKAGIDERDAARAACAGIDELARVASCLKGHGFMLFER